MARGAAPCGQRLAVVGGELRLVVEGVDVRRAALHAQEDHALRPRREVRPLRRAAGFVLLAPAQVQAGEGEVAEPGRGGFSKARRETSGC